MQSQSPAAMPAHEYGDPYLALNVANNKGRLTPAFENAEAITEGQFAAFVRNFDCEITEAGKLYTRDGFPWKYIRSGNKITGIHKAYPLPDKHYIII